MNKKKSEARTLTAKDRAEADLLYQISEVEKQVRALNMSSLGSTDMSTFQEVQDAIARVMVPKNAYIAAYGQPSGALLAKLNALLDNAIAPAMRQKRVVVAKQQKMQAAKASAEARWLNVTNNASQMDIKLHVATTFAVLANLFLEIMNSDMAWGPEAIEATKALDVLVDRIRAFDLESDRLEQERREFQRAVSHAPQVPRTDPPPPPKR